MLEYILSPEKGLSNEPLIISTRSYNSSAVLAMAKHMEGHSGQKCNLIAPCIPLDRTRVPLDRTSIPLDRIFLPLDRTSISLDRIFLPLDRTSISLYRTFLPFDRTSIILSLAVLHWFISLWHFTFNRTFVETSDRP